MIKLTVHDSVEAALQKAFPKPAAAAKRALTKYISVVESMLFDALQRGLTPEQRKLGLYAISLEQLANKGGQIGPKKIRVHKWLTDNDWDIVQTVVLGELLVEVKQRLLYRIKPYKLIGLIQLNTGMRLSEPVFARLEDLVLDHPIPHLWIRRNELSSRKNKSSIRAVPLVGTSLYAAQRLFNFAQGEGSEWLVPEYAHYHGSNSCSAILNKHLKDLDFRSHMFRHALIDRMKACNDIPTRLAESITGHASSGSEFNNYGTVGYTLEQKLEVLKRIAI